ncbi:deoxyribose-phosphate aldolase [Microbaculum marinum]|uniref:Deoxyribose-phosphate aldolase n=1 Tax=Microbaculum marinum TaxID=1764581 RepID=A0AAW9S037_9HYPH
MTKPKPKTVAERALACLDLTNLEDGCSPADIVRLCGRAQTDHGPVAAVCIWPRFVPQAKELLEETLTKIAAVVNFPAGDSPPAWVVGETRNAVSDGADEIDMVIPWRLLRNDPDEVGRQIDRVRKAAKDRILKTILETGELKSEAAIRKATEIAISAGADFVKTSTGKVKVNATPKAASAMLEVIREHGGKTGFKAAGGVRSLDDAATYLGLADDILGKDWARPGTFRFGASGLLDALLAVLEGRTKGPPAQKSAGSKTARKSGRTGKEY